MIHRHILTALHEYLGFYLDLANEQVAIEALKLTAQNPQTLQKTLFLLRENPPSLRIHAQGGSGGLPLIVSKLLSRRVTQRPLGHTVNEIESSISKQDGQLEVFARTSEETEVLTDLVVKCLYQSRQDFLLNGYLSYTVEGLEEITPQEELASEELGVFLRRISVSAMVQEEITRVIPEPTLGTLTIGLIPQGRVNFLSSTML
mgnify:CR=1 FL=1